jgi:hypothetical protein
MAGGVKAPQISLAPRKPTSVQGTAGRALIRRALVLVQRHALGTLDDSLVSYGVDFRVAEHCNWRPPPRFCLFAARPLRMLILRGSCGCLSVFLRVAERIWLHESSRMVCRRFGTSRLSWRTGLEPGPGSRSTP